MTSPSYFNNETSQRSIKHNIYIVIGHWIFTANVCTHVDLIPVSQSCFLFVTFHLKKRFEIIVFRSSQTMTARIYAKLCRVTQFDRRYTCTLTKCPSLNRYLYPMMNQKTSFKNAFFIMNDVDHNFIAVNSIFHNVNAIIY